MNCAIHFSKYEGAGNDFILIDDRDRLFSPTPPLIQKLCHRRFGIGADGLILLQNHSSADVLMRIFNSDGSEASGCGNGTRCLLRFLADLGFPQKPTRIAVGDRILLGDYHSDGFSLEMGEPRNLQLHLQVDEHILHFVDTGVPHVVSFSSASLEHFGPQIRFHPRFSPNGVNVNFADPVSHHIRTYERGVEAETLACGTGATAVALIGSLLYQWKSPVPIYCKGGTLTISFDPSFKNVRMSGPARRVYSGLLLP